MTTNSISITKISVATSSSGNTTIPCQRPMDENKKSLNDTCTKNCEMSNSSADIALGSQTSDYYRTDKRLPYRFNNPDKFGGYDGPKLNPLYRTTNSEYGRLKPNVHTMNVVYYNKNQEFSKRYMKAGNYRNHSLNTAIDHKYS
ncbi:unnamed protein product [Schistosoma curassoni]|nr:unnamed protein product [Schistosoma curassoni]